MNSHGLRLGLLVYQYATFNTMMTPYLLEIPLFLTFDSQDVYFIMLSSYLALGSISQRVMLYGCKPCLQQTWKLFISLICNSLGCCCHKFFSLGWWVILLNYVLNSNPVLSLSFMKFWVKV